ncbi:hypothetical protein BJX68DRAFT_229508 [Aspergillus pseudodeflectus]|uniref:Uncharacterized protein n=1 Tax=Aspergillus pseudodeflectus TaxID=176178 RepID=A0ABR4KYE0_9EURO
MEYEMCMRRGFCSLGVGYLRGQCVFGIQVSRILLSRCFCFFIWFLSAFVYGFGWLFVPYMCYYLSLEFGVYQSAASAMLVLGSCKKKKKISKHHTWLRCFFATVGVLSFVLRLGYHTWLSHR